MNKQQVERERQKIKDNTRQDKPKQMIQEHPSNYQTKNIYAKSVL